MASVLVLPIDSGSYTVYCDASRIGLGVVLMQSSKVIAYALRLLNVHEKNYPIYDLGLALANQFVRLDVYEPIHVLAYTVARSSLFECIRDWMYDDPHLFVLRDTIRHGSAKQVTIGDDGVLRMQDHICVPNVDGLRELIVKCEHHRPGGLLQKLEIPEWKWERIIMDFVIGLPRTQKKFDVVWVIVDRLTKSVHFIQVAITYFSERLAEIYIREIIRLYGVLVSIMSDR
ncbi:uncharacterized protein [Nicotiana sylvestris]|uniref:uncharacterized protein n=1 Tax=Nicotiana sylvestris TaxID=4096 RepID=UPI00388C6697